MHKAAQAYFETQINTTSQGNLLLMLYDGAIKFLHQAKDKIVAKDYAGKGILISKAMDVISELDGSLNVNKGGELAEKMHGLYFYCNTRLLKANLDMDTQLVDEVIKILGGLRSAYAQIIPTEPLAFEAAGQPPAPSQAPAKPKVQAGSPAAANHAPLYGPGPQVQTKPAASPPAGGHAKQRSGANAYSRIASNT